MICGRSDLPEMVKYMPVSHISKCTERRGVALFVASGSQINAERIAVPNLIWEYAERIDGYPIFFVSDAPVRIFTNEQIRFSKKKAKYRVQSGILIRTKVIGVALLVASSRLTTRSAAVGTKEIWSQYVAHR
jgi:uncharacterized protein YigE (DUF2233 family)